LLLPGGTLFALLLYFYRRQSIDCAAGEPSRFGSRIVDRLRALAPRTLRFASAHARGCARDGLERCGDDATLLFNLGVLQEDLGEPRHAADSYRAALDAAPDLADAHFNLARLCASQGLQQEALRHWSAFRRLTARG